MFEPTVREDVLRVAAPGARWLQTGLQGGVRDADAAYNVTVPEGFDRTDIEDYAAERRARVDFHASGPTLLTGVGQTHARGARDRSVVAYATVGLSNPADLPVPADRPPGPSMSTEWDGDRPTMDGTVNLLLGTNRALSDGALAELLATAVEAKAATLLHLAGVPGTTSDAVAVASDPAGEPASFAGSATPIGSAARACVRESVRAALRARYPDGDYPSGLDDADHGVCTTRVAAVFDPTAHDPSTTS